MSWLGEAGTSVEEEERGALGEVVAKDDGIVVALALEEGDRVGTTQAFFQGGVEVGDGRVDDLLERGNAALGVGICVSGGKGVAKGLLTG